MNSQKQWDEYEVALLIEAYFEIKKSPSKRKELLSELSNNLRTRAKNLGYEIDEVFRNLNGMMWQERYIDKAFHSSQNNSRTPSVAFQRMVNMYRENPEKFNIFLKVAKSQIAGDAIIESETQDTLPFAVWLHENYGSKYSSQAILDALDEASQFAISRNLSKSHLTSIDDSTVFMNIMKSLLRNRFFRITHSNISKLLDKTVPIYKQFLDSHPADSKGLFANDNSIEEPDVTTETEITSADFRDEKMNADLQSILKTSFPYGIRLASIRDLMRFKIAAEESNIILPDDETLKQQLLLCGTLIEDKLFAKSDSMEDELGSIIDLAFSCDAEIIYYESLFCINNEWMEQHHIFSEDALKEILKRFFLNFNYSRVFFSKKTKKTEYEAVSGELRRVWGENAIAEAHQLSKDLPYIPYDNIMRVLSGSGDFVWVSEGRFLLADRISITESERINIIQYVEKSCKEKGFASLTDIPLGNIPANNSFAIGNALFLAIYNLLLKNNYRNNGKILTTGDTSANIVSILSEEFKDREEVTFDEVNERVTELNGGSKRQDTFEILYNLFVRVNENLFVSSRKVNFDVEEIDRLLSNIYPTGFGAIRDVTSFALFPVCGYTWNLYLLESFCYRYSAKFYLCVLNFNSKNAGIIASKDSQDSYDQLLATAIARHNVELTEVAAGEYLFQRGMMAKRKYLKLPEIIQEAERIRQEK